MGPDKNGFFVIGVEGPGLLEIIRSDWQHKRKLQSSDYNLLNDSEDADFIVVRVHCGRQVFTGALASGP